MNRPRESHSNHERWLVSYADFVTLMFAFFVVMFASAQADKGHAKRVSEAVRRALQEGVSATGVRAAVAQILGGTVMDVGRGNAAMKGPGGTKPVPEPTPRMAELLPSLQFLSAELEPEIASGKMRLHLEPRGLVVSLQQATFFPSGTDALDPATFDSLAKVARLIARLPNPVRLEGHTDARPIHTVRFHNNWELSAARAIAVLELLSERFEISRQRLAIAGYAEIAPVDTNDTSERRARNRHVDIVLPNLQ